MLDPHKLIEEHYSKTVVPILQDGYKLQSPSNSQEEKERVDQNRALLWKQISSPQITYQSQLSLGHLLESQICVDRPVGRIWSVFGTGGSMGLTLKNEEALYLTEHHQLQLSQKDVPLSVQQAYSLFINNKCSFNEYQVYSNLNRLGFRLTRCDQKSEPPSKNSRKRSLPFIPTCSPQIKLPRLKSKGLNIELRPELLPPNTKLSEPVKAVVIPDLEPLHSNYRGLYQVTDFNTPYRKKVPLSVKSSEYDIKSGEVPFSYGKVKPLLRPEDRTNLGDIYKRLDIFSSSKEDMENSVVNDEAIFNVYAPNTKFKKKSPGNPDYRIAIRSSELDIPLDMNSLCSSQENTNLIQAVVTPNGSLSFFQFSRINLPTDLRME
uniref:tRNA-splicing endonuclease subunit Sen54 N-terminal domain-containing protein n=2 Tax=Lepeophtheirus salmonis TaxID=72036 RepID=A0A0K2UTC5_LEPSM